MKKSKFKKALCWLGFHKWINLTPNYTPEFEKGVSVSYACPHKCGICGKKEYKPMGIIIG